MGLVGTAAIDAALVMVVPVGARSGVGLGVEVGLASGHLLLGEAVLRRSEAVEVEAVWVVALLPADEGVAVFGGAVAGSVCEQRGENTLQHAMEVDVAVHRVDAVEGLLVRLVGQVHTAGIRTIAHRVAVVEHDLVQLAVLAKHVTTTED